MLLFFKIFLNTIKKKGLSNSKNMPSHKQIIQSLQQFRIDQKDGFESINQSTLQLIAQYIAGLKPTQKEKKTSKSYINEYFIKQK